MAYTPVTFVADELLTSTKMNMLAANQAGFNDGSGLGDGIIVTRHVGSAEQLKLGSYSTVEQATRYKWIDGSTIYQKTIPFGKNSTTTTTSVAHNINNLRTVVDVSVRVFNEASGQSGSNFSHPSWLIGARVSPDAVHINREVPQGKDMTGHVTVYYTKI